MTKFILMLAAAFGLTVIAQAADPTPKPSSSAKPKGKTTHHHKTSSENQHRAHHHMTGS
jgi:hypothetical protein